MNDVTPELSAYFSKLGKKGGDKLLKERGREYYRMIAAKRKTHGRQKKSQSEGR